MKKFLPISFFMCLVMLVSACTQQVILSGVTNKKSELVRGLFVPLLPPASLASEVALTQSAEITFNGETHELLLVSEIDRNLISIVGFLPSGIRLFSIVYDGEEINIDGSAKLVESMEPERLLVDMQLALWPLETLQRDYALENHSLVEKKAGKERVLSDNGQEKIRINYSDDSRFSGELNYAHLERGYSIHLTTLEFQVLENE